MHTITTIGLDIAKSVFQVHGIDAQGKVIIRRQLKRRYLLAFFQKLPPCLVGIEACASCHHWSREDIDRLFEVLKRHQNLAEPARISVVVTAGSAAPQHATGSAPAQHAGSALAHEK